MTEVEQYRRAALKEIRSNLKLIKKIAQSALDGFAKVHKVAPIGSVTNSAKFNEDSDVDIGIYVTSKNMPAGMNEDLSWKTQEAFMGKYFDVSGVLNTVVYVMDDKMNEDAAEPITQAQLDALERAADRVFGKLGIDIEFTRHFIDRVNDERNKKQITIRELGELFAKEYKRWGNTIKHMPIDAQAVMKDLSSAINIPFVLSKDGKEKDLVAKTVMRKKDFKSPDKMLPVESTILGKGMTKDARARDIEQSDREYILQKQFKDKWKKENPGKPWPGYHNAGFNDLNVAEDKSAAKDEKKPSRNMSKEEQEFWKWRAGQLRKEYDSYNKKKSVNESASPERLVKQAQEYLAANANDDFDAIALMKKGDDYDIIHTQAPAFHQMPKRGWAVVAYIEYRGQKIRTDTPHKHLQKLLKKDNLGTPDHVGEEVHGAKKGSQVKGHEPTPSKRKPTKGGEIPHPMRGRLVGEGNLTETWKHNIFAGQTTDGVKFTVDKLARKNPRYLVRFKNDDKSHFDNAMVYYDDFETVINLTKQDFDTAIAGGELMRKGRRTAYNGAHQFITPDRRRVGEDTINEVSGGTVVKTVNGYPIHDMGEAYPYKAKRFMIRDPKIDVWASSASTLRDAVAKANSLQPRQASYPKPSPADLEHEAWRDEQRARLATGEVRRAVMSRRGFGESEMDQPPLDVPTPTPAEIAAKHGVELSMIEDQLQMGIKIEMEHTEDPFAAMEIALDHLNEMPNYYDELATIEPHHYTDESVMASWESYQQVNELIDPRQALLDKALKYLDYKVRHGSEKQSLGGYAYDVAREVNLSGIASVKDLIQMYREWKGDSVVTEGWMESNLYYLDEVIREDDDPCWDGYRQLGTKKKKGKGVPNCVPKKK